MHAAVTEALMDPAKWPGSSGTRNLHDNLSDLQAQVAANQKVGIGKNTAALFCVNDLVWSNYY